MLVFTHVCKYVRVCTTSKPFPRNYVPPIKQMEVSVLALLSPIVTVVLSFLKPHAVSSRAPMFNTLILVAGVYLYSNQRGCDGGRLYFDGGALVVQNGRVLQQAPQFSVCDVEVALGMHFYSFSCETFRICCVLAPLSSTSVAPIEGVPRLCGWACTLGC